MHCLGIVTTNRSGRSHQLIEWFKKYDSSRKGVLLKGRPLGINCLGRGAQQSHPPAEVSKAAWGPLVDEWVLRFAGARRFGRPL